MNNQMSKRELKNKALHLANRPYTEETILDETTEGGNIFLIVHPELPGCMAQGLTVKEAQENLRDARFEYLLSLLKDGLPVPDPEPTRKLPAPHDTEFTTTSGLTQSDPIHEWFVTRPHGFMDDLTQAAQPLGRKRVAVVSLVEASSETLA